MKLNWSAGYEEPDRGWIDSQLVRTKTAVEALGYKVSCSSAVAHTAQAIVHEAKRCDAESILLGTRPVGGLGDLSAQSIAVTVAAQAECSVEIVFSAPQERPAAIPRTMATPQAIGAWKGRDVPRGRMVSPA